MPFVGHPLFILFGNYLFGGFFFVHRKKRNERIPNPNLTHRLIDETLGTLSCEQIPSANNRSRISQANIVGFSRL